MLLLRPLFVLLALTCTVQSAKILGVFHMGSYSHYILGSALMKELTFKGHEVTMISPFELNPPVKNYRNVLVPEVMNYFKSMPLNLASMQNMSTIHQFATVNQFGQIVTEIALNSSNVQKLLSSEEQFDLVILEQFVNEAHRGFQHRFKAPCIIFSTVPSSGWVNSLVGNPSSPSYIPEIMSEFVSRMTFLERLENTFLSMAVQLIQNYLNLPLQNDIMHKYFPDAPHITELLQNTSLVLLNSHVSVNQPVPHVPNMIEIGGMHVQAPKKLPDDLQKFLDGAEEGVVYFSLGSNLKSKDLSSDKLNAILNTFSKLKIKVLWKWDTENMPGKPDNVKLGKWFPQQDILAHPNVKVFVTHGGLLSTIETIYHGKPILGIPFFGDQKMNMNSAANNRYGISLSYNDITENTFFDALNEMLSNPIYSDTAKRRSKIMHDQPIKPLDNAVFWVEYVLRHKGAEHFRSAALDLTWFQYMLLDVTVFVTAIFTAFLYVIYLISKKLFISEKNSKQASDKKKKN